MHLINEILVDLNKWMRLNEKKTDYNGTSANAKVHRNYEWCKIKTRVAEF